MNKSSDGFGTQGGGLFVTHGARTATDQLNQKGLRSGYPVEGPSRAGGAEGTRTPDPHTASGTHSGCLGLSGPVLSVNRVSAGCLSRSGAVECCQELPPQLPPRGWGYSPLPSSRPICMVTRLTDPRDRPRRPARMSQQGKLSPSRLPSSAGSWRGSCATNVERFRAASPASCSGRCPEPSCTTHHAPSPSCVRRPDPAPSWLHLPCGGAMKTTQRSLVVAGPGALGAA
ncbi:MAG: hypothetical protein JWN35_1796 [Frankiales bacterium]|nr:hypothetical protein [Frankiales bacterium]